MSCPYCYYDQAEQALVLARWENEAWSLLALDSEDTPRISYYDERNHGLKYARTTVK